MASDVPLQALPLVQAVRPARDATWLRQARVAKWLAWVSLGWLCIEGGVGVAAGIIAGSVALVGFGLDSAIEGLASVIVVWRFTGSRTLSERQSARPSGSSRSASSSLSQAGFRGGSVGRTICLPERRTSPNVTSKEVSE
jgi:hypothetical protein